MELESGQHPSGRRAPPAGPTGAELPLTVPALEDTVTGAEGRGWSPVSLSRAEHSRMDKWALGRQPPSSTTALALPPDAADPDTS